MTVPDLIEDRADGLFSQASAVFDATRTYRYLFTRIWDPERRPLVFLMLNPSTADAFQLDPTASRVVERARREGYGGEATVNLYALRSSNPQALRAHPDPVGVRNDGIIYQAASAAGQVVVAWGAWERSGGRGDQVAARLREGGVQLLCLGTTRSGQPRHPLYVRNDASLIPYVAKAP